MIIFILYEAFQLYKVFSVTYTSNKISNYRLKVTSPKKLFFAIK